MDKSFKKRYTRASENEKEVPLDTQDKDNQAIQEEEKNIKIEDEIKEDAKREALEKVKQRVSIVNVEDLVESEARRAADAYMTESAGKSNFFKKMWKHTFFDEYYRQREVGRVREEIKNSDNIYTRRIKDDNRNAHESAMHAISDRFISEYENTLSAGEQKKIIDNKDPESEKVKNDIKNLINDYAKGALNEEAFKNGRTRILDSLKNEELLKGSHNYADNLFEIAQNAKTAIAHGAKMEELNYDLEIIVGKAKSSLKTEAHLNLIDKAVDRMKKSKVGRFVSPAVLNTAIGLAYSISIGAVKKVSGSKAAALATFGGAVAVSSLFAGANESQRVSLERKQHGIEMAEGGNFEEGDKRREQMERYGYQMESSTDLAQKLRSLMFEKDKNGNETAKDIKEEDLKEIMKSLSDIEARNSLNNEKKIDLISYSGIGNVEKERTDLTILTARAKVELRKRIEGDLKKGIPEGKTFDSYLFEQIQAIKDSLLGGEQGITSQDKAFRKYKAGRVAKKMAQTATVGLLVGGTVQEVVAFFKDDVQGVVESIFHHDSGATTTTPLESLREWINGQSHLEGASALGGLHAVVNESHTVISNAEDYVNNHDTTHVARDMWYDNDTPKPIFEKNELGIQWGGEPGSAGVNPDGHYELNINHMTSDGSSHGDFSVDAQEKMKAGVLKMIFSLTEGTQHQVFEVPIDIHGNIDIDPDSEIGKLFFGTENGHAVFKGRFAEVVESFGIKDGVEHIKTLATLEGLGNDNIPDVITVPVDVPIPVPTETEMPYFIPADIRRPLEPIIYGKKKEEKKGDVKDPIVINENIIKPLNIKHVENEDVVSATEYEKIITEIENKEYDNMGDDIKMLNRKIQTSEGIITLEESNFRSDYGKKRYLELQHIKGGVPVIFNKYELEEIGDEMDNYLSHGKKAINVKKEKIDSGEVEDAIVEKKKIVLKKNIEKRKDAENEADEGSTIETKKEMEENNNKQEEKHDVFINRYGEIIRTNKISVDKTEPIIQKNEEVAVNKNVVTESPKDKESQFTVMDLSKIGTEIYNKDLGLLKITKITEGERWYNSDRIEMVQKDEKGKEKIFSFKKKFVEKQFKKGLIKITKVESLVS